MALVTADFASHSLDLPSSQWQKLWGNNPQSSSEKELRLRSFTTYLTVINHDFSFNSNLLALGSTIHQPPQNIPRKL